jgi:hypothetical protein
VAKASATLNAYPKEKAGYLWIRDW